MRLRNVDKGAFWIWVISLMFFLVGLQANEDLDLGTPHYPDIIIPPTQKFKDAHPVLNQNITRNGENKLNQENAGNLTPKQWADLVPEQVPDMRSNCPSCFLQKWQFDYLKPNEIVCGNCKEVFPDNPGFPETKTIKKTPWGTEKEIHFYQDSDGKHYYLKGQLDVCRFEYLDKKPKDLARAWFQNKESDPEKAAYYASCVEAVLLEYARVYPTYLPVKKDTEYYSTGGPGIINGEQVEEGRPAFPHEGSLWVRWPWTGSIPSEIADVYDICYASPGMDNEVSGTGKTLRRLIEDNIFDVAVNYTQSYQWTFHIRGNTQTHFRKILELARICGRPDYARFVKDAVSYSETMYDLGWDAVSTQGMSYHRLWMNNPLYAAYGLAYYSDPEGYVDSNGSRLDYYDPRTSPNMQRLRWNWRSLVLPDGFDTPVHDASNDDSRPYHAGRQDYSRTRILPAFGEAVLADGKSGSQVEAHLHWSGGNNHAHTDMLNFYLWGNGRELFGDRLTKTSNAHSTVYVDGYNAYLNDLSHDNRGNLELYTPNFQGVSIVRTDGTAGMNHDNGSSRASHFRRTLILNTVNKNKPYVVDLFEVTGGKIHDYRLIGSAQKKQSFASDLSMSANNTFNDYSLSEAQSADLTKTKYVQMTFDEESNIGTRSYFIPQPDTELITARGETLRTGGSDKSAQIILRRKSDSDGLDSKFIAVHELKSGALEIVSLESEWLDDKSIGISVFLKDGRVDYYLLSLDGVKEMSYGPVQCKSTVSVVSTLGVNSDLWMSEGEFTTVNGKTITSSASSFTGSVTSPQRRQTGDTADSFLTDASLPLGEVLKGEAALLEFIDSEGKVLFVNPYTVKCVRAEGVNKRVEVYEDVAFTFSQNGVVEGYKNWREAQNIRLKIVSNTSSVPQPGIMGEEIYFPYDTTPYFTLENGSNLTLLTNREDIKTYLSINEQNFVQANSSIIDFSMYNSPVSLILKQENSDGVYVPEERHFKILTALTPVQTSDPLNGASRITYYSTTHPAYTGVILNASEWGNVIESITVDRIANQTTESSYSAMTAETYVEVKQTGLYTFYYHSGGGRLWINDYLLIDSALIKDSHLYFAAKVYLKKGFHKLYSESFQGYETNELSIEWAGPGFNRTVLSKVNNDVIDETVPVEEEPPVANPPENPNPEDTVADNENPEGETGLPGSSPAEELQELVVNPSFENQNENFLFTNNYADIFLSAEMAGKWVSREKSADVKMSFADISQTLNGQHENRALRLQSSQRRGIAQLVDIRSKDLLNKTINFSMRIGARGRGSISQNNVASYSLYAVKSLDGLSVDLGGKYELTGGNVSELVSPVILADSDFNNVDFLKVDKEINLTEKYDYLLVIFGGLAGVDDSEEQYLAIDNVSLIVKDTAPVETVKPELSPALFWDFNQDIKDISGNGLHGEVTGLKQFSKGAVDSAILLNGSTKISFKPQTPINYSAFTVSFWMRSTQDNQDANTGVFHNNSQNDFQIDFNGSNYLRYNGVNLTPSKIGLISKDLWYHISVVCDGELTRVYLDGEEKLVLDGANNSFGQVTVGVNRGNSKFFSGLIDELLIFDRALSKEEIQAIISIAE